jgi:hypothetical protein
MIPLPQHDNLLISSIYLWLDHYLLDKLQSFSNTATNFYQINSIFNGTQCYASPFSQFIADSSINGAVVGTGVYINGTFSPTGQNGLYHIDYNNGRIYTTGLSTSTITGYFGIKYFNIKLTDEPEERILAETAYSLRPKTNIQATGLGDNLTNYPVIFIKHNGGFNDPLTFGGLETTVNNIRLISLVDTEYAVTALNSALRDISKRNIPILAQHQMPFNLMGDFVSGEYNYVNLTAPIINAGNFAYVKNVYVAKYQQSYVDLRNINSKIYWSIVDLEVHTHRYPRA